MDKYPFDSDYNSDQLHWMRVKAGLPQGNLQAIEELQGKIISDNSSAYAYFFAYDFGYKSHLMQRIILDNKDAKYAFIFAKNIVNCDVKALQQVVLESKKIKYICKFACFVNGANRKLLEPLILKSKKVKYVNMYLKHVQKTDFNLVKEIILTSNKPKYLFELAKHTKDPQILSQIEDLIIKSGSFTYMRLLAEKIKGSNLDKLEEAVLNTDNIEEIKKFAIYVKRSKMKRFFLVL